MVAEANVPSLWTLERRMLGIERIWHRSRPTRVIINRWHKGDEEVLKSIQKDINRPVFACLPNDFRKASASVNLGTPDAGESQQPAQQPLSADCGAIGGTRRRGNAEKGLARRTFFVSGKKVI